MTHTPETRTVTFGGQSWEGIPGSLWEPRRFDMNNVAPIWEALERIAELEEALAELGDYHDDGGPGSIYTQQLVAELLGPDWWHSRFGPAPWLLESANPTVLNDGWANAKTYPHGTFQTYEKAVSDLRRHAPWITPIELIYPIPDAPGPLQWLSHEDEQHTRPVMAYRVVQLTDPADTTDQE